MTSASGEKKLGKNEDLGCTAILYGSQGYADRSHANKMRKNVKILTYCLVYGDWLSVSWTPRFYIIR